MGNNDRLLDSLLDQNIGKSAAIVQMLLRRKRLGSPFALSFPVLSGSWRQKNYLSFFSHELAAVITRAYKEFRISSIGCAKAHSEHPGFRG